jgi:hypothetical protein
VELDQANNSDYASGVLLFVNAINPNGAVDKFYYIQNNYSSRYVKLRDYALWSSSMFGVRKPYRSYSVDCFNGWVSALDGGSNKLAVRCFNGPGM